MPQRRELWDDEVSPSWFFEAGRAMHLNGRDLQPGDPVDIGLDNPELDSRSRDTLLFRLRALYERGDINRARHEVEAEQRRASAAPKRKLTKAQQAAEAQRAEAEENAQQIVDHLAAVHQREAEDRAERDAFRQEWQEARKRGEPWASRGRSPREGWGE
jgi:hypothetical protein